MSSPLQQLIIGTFTIFLRNTFIEKMSLSLRQQTNKFTQKFALEPTKEPLSFYNCCAKIIILMGKTLLEIKGLK